MDERTRTLFQCPIRRLIVRSRKISKQRGFDLYSELSDRSEIWLAACACQISKRYQYLNNRFRTFETLRDLTISRLIGYWKGALNFDTLYYSDILSWYWWNLLTSANQIAQIGSCDRSRIHVPDLGGTGVWPGKNCFHKKRKSFDNIAVHLITSLKSKWKNKQISMLWKFESFHC